jgi:hypothetical protein
MKYLQKSFSVGFNMSEEDHKRIFGCSHEWAPMFTDRDSPESFPSARCAEGGPCFQTKYRGWREVGRKCRKCGENEVYE